MGLLSVDTNPENKGWVNRKVGRTWVFLRPQQHCGRFGWGTNCVGSSDRAGPHLPARKAKPSAPEPSAQAAHVPQRAFSSMLSPLLPVLGMGHARDMGDWHMSLPLAFEH